MQPPGYDELLATIALRFGVTLAELMVGRRTKWRTRLRHVAAALLYETGELSYPDVARLLKYGDHTGARAAVLAGRKLLEHDQRFAGRVRDLRTPRTPDERR